MIILIGVYTYESFSAQWLTEESIRHNGVN